MTPKRLLAKDWLEHNFPGERGQKRSNVPADNWLDFCTQPHSFYIRQWKAGQTHETSCKDFTIKYCGTIMGMDSRIGSLREDVVKGCLSGLGKSCAWVDSRAGRVPEIGDICYWSSGGHVGVSRGTDIGLPTDPQWTDLDVQFWYTVEGGQDQIIFEDIVKGDPSKGKQLNENASFAWIKWKKYPDAHPKMGGEPTGRYDPGRLKGWVSIDRYFYGENPLTYPEASDSQPAADNKPTSSLWRNDDGEIVHPNAPVGGGGSGYFCSAGPLAAYPFPGGSLPHPSSPAAQYLDPPENG